MINFEPRDWQKGARAAVLRRANEGSDRACLDICTGAGKTAGALYITNELLTQRFVAVETVIACVPNRTIVNQWAATAGDLGFSVYLDARFLFQPSLYADADGARLFIFTYDLVISRKWRDMIRGFVDRNSSIFIADECHHMAGGDSDQYNTNAWGRVVEEVFGSAAFKLSVTGTPFRTDYHSAIAFGEYDADDRLAATFRYTYADAVRDGVVRPVTIFGEQATARWESGPVGDVVAHSAVLNGEPIRESIGREALRQACEDLEGCARDLFIRAHACLCDIRATDPTAGGIVRAMTVEHAEKIGDMIADVTGTRPPVIHTGKDGVRADGKDPHFMIALWRDGADPWVVHRGMMAEGTNTPRARVFVRATNMLSELDYVQDLGRILRMTGDDQEAFMFQFDHFTLRRYAETIEEEKKRGIEARAEYAPSAPAGVRRPYVRKSIRGYSIPSAATARGLTFTQDYQARHSGKVEWLRKRHPEVGRLSTAHLLALLVSVGEIPHPTATAD